MKQSTGLCDSNGNELFIGDVIKRKVEINTPTHGEWALYRISQQGMTPILLYKCSQKGQILPDGYMGTILADLYDPKTFIFMRNSLDLRPTEVIEKELT